MLFQEYDIDVTKEYGGELSGGDFERGDQLLPEEIEYRRITQLESLTDFQQLEQEVWQTGEYIPNHQLYTVAKNGGILFGAYHGGKIIGMLYSFPGFLAGETYLCSHMMGISRQWRGRGIGERLKRLQAEAATEQGYQMITWTYDPLQTANGYLNMHKLGTICRTYLVDCYGEMNDQLNQGLPSDRLQVELWLNRPCPKLPTRATMLISWRLNNNGLPQPTGMIEKVSGNDAALVAVPAHLPELKEHDLSLAQEWRLAVRQALTESFAAGWVLADCRRSDGLVHEYVLIPSAMLALPAAPWQKASRLLYTK